MCVALAIVYKIMIQTNSSRNQYLPTADHENEQTLAAMNSQQSFGEQLQSQNHAHSPQECNIRQKHIKYCCLLALVFIIALVISIEGQTSLMLSGYNRENKESQAKQTNQSIIDRQNIKNAQKPLKHQSNYSFQSFNLWDLSKDEKIALYSRYHEFFLSKKVNSSQKFMNILGNKDVQDDFYLQKFEQNAQIIEWHAQQMSQAQSQKYKQQFDHLVSKRQSEIAKWFIKYKDYESDGSLMSLKSFVRNITKEQFYRTIKYHQMAHNSQQTYKTLYEYEKASLQEKYKLSEYKGELRACVIVPTSNNVRANRYLWNIQSILSQEYSNLKVIIIDDASTDATSAKIAQHLRWRKANPQQYILIRSKVKNKSLYNFYYAAHRYCDLGEILYTIDGDDELIGTQVFKLFNVIYQRQKPYTMYSIFITDRTKELTLGNNHDYPLKVKNENSYRYDKSHGYSHLRTMLSDTFLLVNATSLQSQPHQFFKLITDNAVYFCAMELSCQRVRFLQEITYWYQFTGVNLEIQTKRDVYLKTLASVEGKMPYRCIHDYLRESQQWHKQQP